MQAVSAQKGYYISCIDRLNSYIGIVWLIRTDAFFVMYDQTGNMLGLSEYLNEEYYIEAFTADNDDGFLAMGKDGYGQESWIRKGSSSNSHVEY